MNKTDRYFIEAIKDIRENGSWDEKPRPHYKDGTPAHTLSINHVVRTYDLQKEFPITTLRPIAWKSAIKEILWIYKDQTSELSVLEEKYNNYVWSEWDIGDRTIGQRYGATVKRYDLMNKLIKGLIENPDGRRHIIDLYQYADLEDTEGLHPCAFLTIWNVRYAGKQRYLDMMLVQRSGDMITASGAGGYNEVQYAALQIAVADIVDMLPGKFTHVIANEQIYDRHLNATNELLERYKTLEGAVEAQPRLVLSGSLREHKNGYPPTSFLDNLTIESFDLKNYFPCQPQLELDIGI